MKKKNFDKMLTKDEQDALSYLDWSNETLGRLTRHCAQMLFEKDPKGWEGVKTMSACLMLINIASSMNAGEMKQTIEDATRDNENLGDWEIIVRRKK